MTERIELLSETIREMNRPGVQHSHLYPLAGQSIKETRGQSLQIRRAKAQAYILDHAPLALVPYELLAGSLSSFCPVDRRKMNPAWQHAVAVRAIELAISRKRDGQEIPQGQRALMRRMHRDSVIPYGDLQALIEGLSEEHAREGGLSDGEIAGVLEEAFQTQAGGDGAKEVSEEIGWTVAGRLCLDGRVLEMGFRGLEEQAKDGRNRAKSKAKQEFFIAQRLVVQACERFILRYANALSGEANRTGGKRGEELSKMAVVLRKLSTEPADSFYEGVQLLWLLSVMAGMVGGASVSFGRFDQILGTRYDRDIAEGAIQEDEAKELLCCLWLKMNELGMGGIQCMTLGGCKADGSDAVNALSRLCLAVTGEMRLPQPNVCVRVGDETPEDFWELVVTCIQAGGGQPTILNDEAWVPNLKGLGLPLAEANGYAAVGNGEVGIPGKMASGPRCHPIAFPVAIERAFEDMYRGGPMPATFEGLMEVCKAELQVLVKKRHIEAKQNAAEYKEWYDPFSSMLVKGCLESGHDVFQGGAELFVHVVTGLGLGTAVDALCSVKKWVFEQGEISMEQLVGAVKEAFGRRRHLRQLLGAAPCFGCGDEGANGVARELVKCFGEAVGAENRPGRKEKYVSVMGGDGDHVRMRGAVGALPNGRRAGEAISRGAEVSVGRDKAGIDGVLGAMLAVGSGKLTGGCAVDVRVGMVKDEERERLKGVLRRFVEGGGLAIGVYAAGVDRLRDATACGVLGEEVIVRVDGHCEYFLDLGKALQDELILRTEHALG